MDKSVDQTKLRILLLEDTPTDAELVENALREAGLSFTARRVDTRAAFLQALEEFKPDIVLADYHLPAFDGGAALKIVQQQYPDTPVVMVTGAVGDEKAVELLRQGAKDYVLKDRLARLGSAVRRALSEAQDIRARKAAELALRESEARFRLMADSALALIWIADTNKSCTWFNKVWLEFTGRTMEQELGNGWAECVHPDDLPHCLEVYTSHFDRREVFRMEYRLRRHDGEYRWLFDSGAPRFDEEGNFAGYIGSCFDITERKLVEEQIRFSEALLRQTQSLAAIGSWRLYMPRNELIWSDETYRIFGIPVGTSLNYEDFIGQIHPDDRALVNSSWQAALKGAPYCIQHRIIVNGETRWVEERADLEFDAQGNLYAGTGAVQDITERKQTEEKIQKQSRLLDLILANSQENIVLLDKDYNFIKVSASYAKSCQRQVAEFPGHNHFEFYPSSLKDEFDEALSRNLIYSSTDRPFSFPDHPEWGVTYWDLGMVPIRDAENKIELLLLTLRDVTKRKQAEARIQKLTRLYATLSKTNETIVRATNREELFCRICEGAVTHGKFVLAWVGMVDEATHLVKPVCHYGVEGSYLTNLVVSSDDVLMGRGPTGTSIRENRVSYINDFTTDERTLPWREAGLKHGFHGVAGLPLRFENKVVGALTLYTDEPNFFDSDQMNLLEEMATDISFALEGFGREAQRRQAEKERETALSKLRDALEGSIQVAVAISEMRDPYTSGHQRRVSKLAVAIAREMGLGEAQIDGIRFGSLIHDIGKIGVPAEILSKTSELTTLQRQLIQEHSEAGYNIIKDIDFPWAVAQMIRQHHERLDGSGYPAGLKADEIILEAKIIGVADTVEAMSSYRPYRPGLGMDAALAEITNASGVRYDPQVVETCIRLIREKGFSFL